jgi:hypothetical protein
VAGLSDAHIRRSANGTKPGELLALVTDEMGHDEDGRDERPAPEPFEVFYLREYPKVVGLLQGLLRSRLVAEELAQETFLVAYRDGAGSVGSTTRAPGSARSP